MDAHDTVTDIRTMPLIQLGTLSVSRLVMGSNPFFGISHRDKPTDEAMRAYFTPERLRSFLDEAADLGVNAVAAPVYPNWILFWTQYRSSGGRLAHWVAQPDPPGRVAEAIDEAARAGASAVFVQGARVDEMFAEGRYDVLKSWLDQIRAHGLPAGLASHKTDTFLTLQDADIVPDFYFQCLFTPRSYQLPERREALAVVRQLPRPVVVYKVLGAGRHGAAESFRAVLQGIRPTDGLCVGMYPPDNPAMLRENVDYVLTGIE